VWEREGTEETGACGEDFEKEKLGREITQGEREYQGRGGGRTDRYEKTWKTSKAEKLEW
jgi:hypothetical protein